MILKHIQKCHLVLRILIFLLHHGEQLRDVLALVVALADTGLVLRLSEQAVCLLQLINVLTSLLNIVPCASIVVLKVVDWLVEAIELVIDALLVLLLA